MAISSRYHWGNRRILIVEDDDSSSFLLGEILKRTGAFLSYAFTGNEAVEYIRAHPATDLVLMDIHLPGKDGITAAREIKSINKEIKVITQSAYLDPTNEAISLSSADDYLEKPINPMLLLSKIENYLG